MSMVTPIPRAGNRMYPLPPDYDTLTKEGQRLARVNACRLNASPEEAIAAWAWWVRYYLQPDPETGWDPGFYKGFKPFAPAHYHMIGWMHQFQCNAIGAPRGFAKSHTKKSKILQDLVAGEGKEIATIVSKEDLGIREIYQIRMQLENNPRIIADFGDLRMARGSGIWNNHSLALSNRNLLSMHSIDSKIRGIRPDVVYVDDIELDDDYKTRATQTVADTKEKIQKVIIPMLEEKSRIVLLGTMVSKQAFLYHVICTDDDDQFRSVARGGPWWKINIPAFDGKGNNAWKEKYTPEFLDTKRRQMGDSFFRTEYLGEPGSDEDAPFSLRTDAHEYELEGVTPPDLQQPLLLSAPCKYFEEARVDNKDTLIQRQFPMGEHFSKMTRVITVDYAEGLTSAHDYSAVVVGALDSRNDLWILDAWQGRVWAPALAQKVWEMAERWQVGQIAVESVSTQMEIVRLVRQWGEGRGTSGWAPSVIPLKYPANLSKGDRIMGLEWRFNQGKIKLPAARRDQPWFPQDAIPELYRQIRDFTPNLRNLRHDDVIDAVAMLQYVFKNRGAIPNPAPQAVTLEERISQGEVYYPGTQIPLISAIDFRTLPQETLSAIIDASLRARYERPLARPEEDDPALNIFLPQGM